MHGPTRRAGAVGCLEGIKTASEVAKCVLKYTDHIFLVGEGAKRFALEYGFKEENLLTDASREAWLHWRANLNPNDSYLDVPAGEAMVARPTGTINCDAVAPNGDISSVTTTAGIAFKVPGRVGDSAVVGAGQYTDNDIGAAGSTGLGEANIKARGGADRRRVRDPAGRSRRPAALLEDHTLPVRLLQLHRRVLGCRPLRQLQSHRLR